MKSTLKIANSSARYLAGEMSDSEAKQFLFELKHDRNMQEEYQKMRKTWQKFDTLPAGKFDHSNRAWNNLKERLSRDGLLDEANNKRQTSKRYLLRIAASILIIAALGITATMIFSTRKTDTSLTIAYDESSADYGYMLPDGSHVFLNEGAVIKLAATFPEKREIILSGEAFFDIRHDPSRPFSIHADKTVITVLGTTFNVKENIEDDMVEVLVQTGKVKVQGTRDSKGITLISGQFGRSDGNRTELSTLNDFNYLSWKTKEFRFVNTSLRQILSTLEQSYHVTVDTGDVNLEDLKLTSTYKEQSFESILQTICTAFNISYVSTGNGYKLSGH